METQILNLLESNEYFIRVKVDDQKPIDSLFEWIEVENPIFQETTGIWLKGGE